MIADFIGGKSSKECIAKAQELKSCKEDEIKANQEKAAQEKAAAAVKP